MREFHKKRYARWRGLLCIIYLVASLLGAASVAHAATTAQIVGSAAVAEKGDTVTVDFYLGGNPGVWGMKGEISYDTSALTLKSLSAGNVFSSAEMIMGEDMKKSPAVFLATGSTIADKKKDGTLIKATFTVNSGTKLGNYAVNLRIIQFINIKEEDVAVSTSGATISVVKCLHRNYTLKNVVEATEERDGYSGDTFCETCRMIVKKGTKVPKIVNTCEHLKDERVVIKEANCTEEGLVIFSCQDCGKELLREGLSAWGHKESPPVNWKAATTTEEGYSGDIYCLTCDALLQSGTVIPKIPIQVFQMTVPAEDTYYRDDPAGLIFVSAAELDTFVRVEIDGAVLDAQNYTVERGSTKVTLKPECLEKLTDGKHTVTIVSDAGTASAQFYITAEKEPENRSEKILLTVAIVAVVALVGCLAYILTKEFQRKKAQEVKQNET